MKVDLTATGKAATMATPTAKLSVRTMGSHLGLRMAHWKERASEQMLAPRLAQRTVMSTVPRMVLLKATLMVILTVERMAHWKAPTSVAMRELSKGQ